VRRRALLALLSVLVLGLALTGSARAADRVYVVDEATDNYSSNDHCVDAQNDTHPDCSIVDALSLASKDAATDHDVIKFLLTPVTLTNSIPLSVPGNVTLQGCPDPTPPSSAPCVEVIGPNRNTNVFNVITTTADQRPAIDHVAVSKANVAVRSGGPGTLTVTGCYFGLRYDSTSHSWTAPSANHVTAAVVQPAATGPIVVGGPATGQPNIISNSDTGIVVRSPGANLRDNVISGTTTGLDVGATGASVTANVVLGGTGSATGLLLGGDDESGATVSNNFFGVNLFGVSAPFSGSAVRIRGDANTVQGNTIADHAAQSAAVTIEDGDRNVLTSNFVGTDSATDDLGPAGPGILLTRSGTGERDGANGNRIGGDDASEANVISFSAGPAIALQGASGAGNVFARNTGQSNRAPFIDIGAAGPGGEGPLNGGVKAPVISVAGQGRVSGTAAPGGLVRLFRVGVSAGEVDSWVGNAVAAPNGTWSFTPTAPLEAPGRIAASVTVAGGTSELSANPVVVDDIAPETTIAVGPSSRTRDATPQFYFTANEANSTFECRTGAAAFAACRSPHTLATLRDGRHTFAVRARDPAGNVDSTPAVATFTVDTKGPRVALRTTRARLHGRTVALRVSCARTERASCSGDLTVRASVHGLASRLARARFRVRPGKTRTVRARVAAKAATWISAHGRLRTRALLDARDDVGNRTRVTRRVTVVA
jgi:hypothetical protein